MDLLDETSELAERKESQRPVFLTVLCILTWAACGIALISGLIQLWSYSAISEITNRVGNQAFGENYYAIMFWSTIATFVSAIICALGAFFMFRLKKIGFFIYLFGQVIAIFFSVFPAFSTKIPEIGGVLVLIGLVSLIFPIAFIIMYGVHFKHFK